MRLVAVPKEGGGEWASPPFSRPAWPVASNCAAAGAVTTPRTPKAEPGQAAECLGHAGPVMLRATARTFMPGQGTRESGTFPPTQAAEAFPSGRRQRCPKEDTAQPPAAAAGQASEPLPPAAATVATVPGTPPPSGHDSTRSAACAVAPVLGATSRGHAD